MRALAFKTCFSVALRATMACASMLCATWPGQLRAQSVLAEGTAPTMILEEGAGEGPAWDPELGLLTSGNGRIMRLSNEGEQSVYRQEAGSNGLLFDRQGRLLVCEPGHRSVSRIDRQGRRSVLAAQFEGHRFNSPNDISVDSKGRIYFSDPRYGNRDDMELLDSSGRKTEGVYRIDADGSVSRIIEHQVDRPNGLLVSPDDRYLFVADNNNNVLGGARKLWRFNLRDDGTVDFDSRVLVHDWGSSRGPDGMAIDQTGRLFVAGGLNQDRSPVETNDNRGGIYVFSAAGAMIEFIPIPRDEVTNCAFGGKDLRTLYITAGGTLWTARVNTPGHPRWPPQDQDSR